jgi:4-amino-4-deoxy-L-arabinose transferase-like glycosyltransferase
MTATGARVLPAWRADRTERVALLLILLLALGLRLWLAWQWNAIQPNDANRLVGDEPGYDNIAREVLAGYGFTWPGRTPLYSLWLAAVYVFSAGSYAAVPYAQSLLGVLAVALTYVLGRRQFGPATGLLAALMAAMTYPLLHQSLRLLSEVLYTPLLLVVTLALAAAVDQPRRGRFAQLGTWIGLSNLVRPTLLLFPVFLLPIFWRLWGRRHGLRLGLIALGLSLLVVSPWIAYNYDRHNAIIALQTSNALLWQGSPEYFHLIRHEGYTYQRMWSEVLYGPGWQERDPTSIAGDRYWTRRAVRSIAAEPLVYTRYATEKLFTFWIGDPNADWENTYVFNYGALVAAGVRPDVAALIWLSRMLPIVALAGFVVLRRQWDRLRPQAAVIVYFTLLHAATHAEVRLSEPLLPLLLVVVAAAVVYVTQRFQASRPKSIPTDAS